MAQSQTITLQSGDALTVKSADGSPLTVAANPYHQDVVTLTVAGGEIEPPPVTGNFWIGAWRPTEGVIHTRSSLSGGPAEGLLHPPDPHSPSQVVIGDAVWSFSNGAWKGPAGEHQQFGQAGDTPLGGQFGANFGKCVARIEDRYGQQGRLFRFAPGSYLPEYWLGATHDQRAFSHCYGEGPTPWFIGLCYDGGLWLIRTGHGSDKRISGDFRSSDQVVSAPFVEGRAGLAVIRGNEWRVWTDIGSMNPSHPDESFTFGDPNTDIPLACG